MENNMDHEMETGTELIGLMLKVLHDPKYLTPFKLLIIVLYG